MFYALYSFGINSVEQQAEVHLCLTMASTKLAQAIMRLFYIRGCAWTQNVNKDMSVLGPFVKLPKATITYLLHGAESFLRS